mgnify:CR=1 FL=1
MIALIGPSASIFKHVAFNHAPAGLTAALRHKPARAVNANGSYTCNGDDRQKCFQQNDIPKVNVALFATDCSGSMKAATRQPA